MSTRSRRLRWWEGGSQWEASQGSHARCAGSVRAVVGSGQGGQAHPSCPASARFQHFDPEESRTCGIHCTGTLGIQDPVNPALLPKKVGANGEPFAHRTDIFFTRTHNRGISLRRRYLLPPEADNQWAGQAHPCDGCHRTQPGCPRQILGYTGRRHLTHELDIQHVGITRSWRWDISTPLDVTGGLRWHLREQKALRHL